MKCCIGKSIPSGGPYKKFKLNETSEIAIVRNIGTRPEYKINFRLGNIMCPLLYSARCNTSLGGQSKSQSQSQYSTILMPNFYLNFAKLTF